MQQVSFNLILVFSFAIPQSLLQNFKPHTQNDEHNVTHDQAKFLGEHLLPEFSRLDPKQATESLKAVFKETDQDKDGFIDFSEMYERLKMVEDQFTNYTSMRQWRIHNPENKTFVTWNMIMNNSYSFLDQNDTDEEFRANGQKYMARDKIRFAAADENQDGKLDAKEYLTFTNPASNNGTKHIILDEIFSDMDSDGDGLVTFDEFISEIFHKSASEDPDWVKTERQLFLDHRDKDKDGKLNKDEVKEMFFPSNYDPSGAEAHHLIADADDNKDNKLSIEEMLKHSEMFINSPVAHWERDTSHDEL